VLRALLASSDLLSGELMAALIEAITGKRKMVSELEGAPYYCLEAEVSTPTARGGQTLVRLKMRNGVRRGRDDDRPAVGC
jgi:hypothetical protein